MRMNNILHCKQSEFARGARIVLPLPENYVPFGKPSIGERGLWLRHGRARFLCVSESSALSQNARTTRKV